MFDLETPSQSQWAVQVLTLDFMIEGLVDAQQERLAFHLVGGDARAIRVTSAKLLSTGQMLVPSRSTAPWTLVYGNRLIALIPRDPVSLAYAQKENADFKNPVPADVYAGPYLIRGQIMSPDQKLRVFAGYPGFVVQDARIDCLLQGSLIKGLQAPYVLVLGQHKGLIVPRG